MGLHEVAGEGSEANEWSEHGPATLSKGTAMQSFGPIGRHARIVRVTLQNRRLKPALGATPAEHHVAAAMASSCTSLEAQRYICSLKREGKSG
jgi:hypothetical protein